ncbi:PaaI family thioesterase [Microbulbifer sp. VTAC004]|uniref:PaaI family thioesterase n=1 Tax=Microbulbifer sp. VTAC004 TaxID=3243386 RepID=UPI004039A679
MKDIKYFNDMCAGRLPELLGIKIINLDELKICAEMDITASHLAPNGYLHAGSVVSLADTACGIGCIANLPKTATGFTTLELKSNHLSTVREGRVECIASPIHKGRTTQVWDAVVLCLKTGKKISLFRCTQMLLYP